MVYLRPMPTIQAGSRVIVPARTGWRRRGRSGRFRAFGELLPGPSWPPIRSGSPLTGCPGSPPRDGQVGQALARQRRPGREVSRSLPTRDLGGQAVDDQRPRVAAHGHLAVGGVLRPSGMREVHDGAAALRGLEPPGDRRADPPREPADRAPLNGAARLELVDPQLERLGPVGAEPEARDRSGLLWDLKLVRPVAGQAFLDGMRFLLSR
jgi:hypothetical protein